MARRWRVLRVLTWAGIALSLMTAGIWVASEVWLFALVTKPLGPGRGDTSLWVSQGTIRFFDGWPHSQAHAEISARRLTADDRRASVLARRWWPKWHYEPHPFWTPSDGDSPLVSWTEIAIPLWLPLAVLTTTALLPWYLDRRRIPPGHCRRCGYDLTGNVSGVCPECGAAVRKDEEMRDERMRGGSCE